jgi:DNA-binding transcriptional ArsR family regulator
MQIFRPLQYSFSPCPAPTSSSYQKFLICHLDNSFILDYMFNESYNHGGMYMEERVLELKADILRALAQPTRLKILELLRNGEKCICEIVPALNGEQSNISRHISLMQKSNLVATRKDGVKVMVKVRDPKIFDILDKVSAILKSQVSEQNRLIRSI